MIASIRDISQKGDPGGPWGTLGVPKIRMILWMVWSWKKHALKISKYSTKYSGEEIARSNLRPYLDSTIAN